VCACVRVLDIRTSGTNGAGARVVVVVMAGQVCELDCP